MSTEWIKMRLSLRTDPRVSVLAAKLGKTKAEIIGGLCLLWMIADEHGDFLPGMDAVTLSFEIGVTGLVEALPESWVKVTPEGVYFPNYSAHNGSTAKHRALSQTRMAKHRERKRYDASVTTAQPEKKREELTTTTKTVAAAPPVSGRKPKQTVSDTEPIPDDLKHFENVIREWVAYRRKLGKPILQASWNAFLGNCRASGPKLPAMVKQSIANGWQGLFEPKAEFAGKTVRQFQTSQGQGDKFHGIE